MHAHKLDNEEEEEDRIGNGWIVSRVYWEKRDSWKDVQDPPGCLEVTGQQHRKEGGHIIVTRSDR